MLPRGVGYLIRYLLDILLGRDGWSVFVCCCGFLGGLLIVWVGVGWVDDEKANEKHPYQRGLSTEPLEW